MTNPSNREDAITVITTKGGTFKLNAPHIAGNGIAGYVQSSGKHVWVADEDIAQVIDNRFN